MFDLLESSFNLWELLVEFGALLRWIAMLFKVSKFLRQLKKWRVVSVFFNPLNSLDTFRDQFLAHRLFAEGSPWAAISQRALEFVAVGFKVASGSLNNQVFLISHMEVIFQVLEGLALLGGQRVRRSFPADRRGARLRRSLNLELLWGRLSGHCLSRRFLAFLSLWLSRRSLGWCSFRHLLLLSPLFDDLSVLKARDLVDVVAHHQQELELVVAVASVFELGGFDLVLRDLPGKSWQNLAGVRILHEQLAVTKLVVKRDLLSHWEVALLLDDLHGVLFILVIELVVDRHG